jgi:hypothetical protein
VLAPPHVKSHREPVAQVKVAVPALPIVPLQTLPLPHLMAHDFVLLQSS